MDQVRYSGIPINTKYNIEFTYSKSKLITFIPDICYTNHYYNFNIHSVYIGANCGFYLQNNGDNSDFVDIRYSIFYFR